MLYRANRLSRSHQFLRRAAYSVLNRLPDSLKYRAGSLWRTLRQPYRLLRAGDCAVQIGAPWDTLLAGRSRAVYFARRVGRTGMTIVIEPADNSVQALRSFVSQHALAQLRIIQSGVWNSKTSLRFLEDPEHPAANLIEEVIVDGRDRSLFSESVVEVDTLDNLLGDIAPETIRLLSVTTNGSELQILQGAEKTLSKVQYVSTITTDVDQFLANAGFRRIGGDDRGYLYRNSRAGTP